MVCLWVFPLALALNLPLPASPLFASCTFLVCLSPPFLPNPLTGSQLALNQPGHVSSTQQWTTVLQGWVQDGIAALGAFLSWEDRNWFLQLRAADLHFHSELSQSAPMKLKSTLEVCSTVTLKMNYTEGNKLGSVLLSHFDVWIASASGFPYACAEFSAPPFPSRHMRKPWAQCAQCSHFHTNSSFMVCVLAVYRAFSSNICPALCWGDSGTSEQYFGKGS